MQKPKKIIVVGSFRDVATHDGEKNKNKAGLIGFFFSLRAGVDDRQRTRGAHDLVDASTERRPLRATDFQNVLVRCVERRMEFEERVGRGAVIRPVQRLEYLVFFVPSGS